MRLSMLMPATLALALAACDGTTESLVDTRTELGRGWSMVVPAGWELRGTAQEGKRMFVSPVEGPEDEFRENLGTTFKVPGETLTLTQFWAAYRASASLDPDYTVEDGVETVVAGRPALWASAVSRSKARTYVQWVVDAGDGRFLVFTGTTPNATRDRSMVVFKKMIASVELVTPAPGV